MNIRLLRLQCSVRKNGQMYVKKGKLFCKNGSVRHCLWLNVLRHLKLLQIIYNLSFFCAVYGNAIE